MRALDSSIQLDLLGQAHMRQIVPVILGARGFQHYQNEVFISWRQFRQVVSRDFGMSESQLRSRFFAMQREGGETGARFVLRVERERRNAQVPEESTLHCFLARLEPEVQRQIEEARTMKLAL